MLPHRRYPPLVPLALLLCLDLGCGTKFEACEDNLTCPKSAAGAAGEAGEATHTSTTDQGAFGGSESTGGAGGTRTVTTTTTSVGGSTSSSTGGTGGSHGGTGGVGGNSVGGSGGTGALPCAGACGGATPVCDEANDTCVECLHSDDCDEGVCDPDAQRCVECLETADCDTGVCDAEVHACVECLHSDDCDEGVCDPDAQHCVECLETTDCSELSASWCDDQSCAPCQTNADCAHLAGTTVCDVPTGECVECTGTDYTSCGLNDLDEPLVCDSLTRTCSDQVEHTLGLCQSCVSDASCRPGHLCVLQSFNDQDVGYFCLWQEGDTENGTPADCFATGRPYVDRLVDAESIDGDVATICGLAVSTCPALAEFRTKDCAPDGTPDDTLCGVDAPNDAKCVPASPSSYRCTMRCGSSEDCPSDFACDTSVGEWVCEL